jgi:pyruvate dehydrogenase E2 component (dihydrolipoamide acetyltransferase)
MTYDVLMPKLGLTMTEGTMSEWQVKQGDVVSVGDILCMFETDKTIFEIEAEHAGTVLEIEVPEGTTVEVGARLARINTERVELTAGDESRAQPLPMSSQTVKHGNRVPAASIAEASSPDARGAKRIVATPYARKLAREGAVDVRGVTGTGPGGRVKAADVLSAASATTRSPGAVTRHSRYAHTSPARVATARRVSESKPGIPHFYLTSEAEVSAVEALRSEWRATGGERRPTITDFIVAAVGRALADLPEANAIWTDNDVVTLGDTDVGLVVHSTDGLFLPILRDAGRKPLARIATENRDLIERARTGRLNPGEMSGGAIAVSNAGMHNVTYLTPLINPGQSAMLGVGSVRQLFRPDAQGNPELRRELGLVLAADHRVFDGVSGLVLLNRIISYVETPQRLLS